MKDVSENSKMRVYAALGNTSYMIEEAPTLGVLKIIRRNGDGKTEFFVPRELVTGYAREIAKSQIDAILMKVLE